MSTDPAPPLDWEHLRRHRYIKEAPPPEWKSGLRPVSMEGLPFLAVDPTTNELYWDGQKLITERKLASFERWLAGIATVATVVTAAVEVAAYFAP